MQTLRVVSLVIVGALVSVPLSAQNNPSWKMLESGTTATLRGIDSVDGKVAWASGTKGTVLRTTDGGLHWEKCSVPDEDHDGATLEFGGIHAWDSRSALLIASGNGKKSRLYRTIDGCKSWKLLYVNGANDGYWDSLAFYDRDNALLLGDPTKNYDPAGLPKTREGAKTYKMPRLEFSLFFSFNAGANWTRQWYASTPTPLQVPDAESYAAFS